MSVALSTRWEQRDEHGIQRATTIAGVALGDLRLLANDTARRLLRSALPAPFAYVALDDTPRVVPTWFHWIGEELVMPTFLAAPH
jgi:hypothetical protein